MRKFIMSFTTVASLSLAAVPVLGLTQAANAAQPTARVAYGDLNLASPTQAAIFKARVETAGRALCMAKMRAGELDAPVNACVAAAHREAEQQLPKAQRQALAVAAAARTVEVAAK
ncbi:UrcA family protein [Caulobacter segnis]|uniref:UrcA family protein n=1 Tax=Caulobacter segnis TaxID=88688 RepID=UPI0028551BDC|nr:UrcA family protein [Caulobacter segnis]MDR6627470.1 UrcA family protein [Caulobacter segnis]